MQLWVINVTHCNYIHACIRGVGTVQSLGVLYHCYSGAEMIISAQLHGENCISVFLYSDSEAWALHYAGVLGISL